MSYEEDSKARDSKIRFGRELEPIVFEREKQTKLSDSDTSMIVDPKIDTLSGIDASAISGGGGTGNFEEEELTYCVDGAAVTKVFLVRDPD